jgi:hypothetical protein
MYLMQLVSQKSRPPSEIISLHAQSLLRSASSSTTYKGATIRQ